MQGRFEHGQIQLKEGEWTKEFIDQLLNFPTSNVHDDLLDALSYIDQLAVTPFEMDDYDDEYEPLDAISGY